MSLTALALVIAAAFIHASWNFLAKRVSSAGQSALAFVVLTSFCVVVLYAVPTVWLMIVQPPHWGWLEWALLLASAVTHIAYSLCLQRGYQVGDLSVVYPLARGTGPLLSTFGAIIILGEPANGQTIVGALLVIAGVWVIAGGEKLFFQRGATQYALKSAVAYGLLTGLCIALYTLIDAYAVTVLLITPLLLDYVSILLRLLLMAPFFMRDAGARQSMQILWHSHRKSILIISALMPLSYILVLSAMRLAPVSHIAPVRELSMMVAAYLGARVLNEGEGRRRLLAAGLIVTGVALLALAK